MFLKHQSPACSREYYEHTKWRSDSVNAVNTDNQLNGDPDDLGPSHVHGPHTLATVLNIAAGLCGLWFCFYGIVWAYLIALWTAYPIGLLGWCLHNYAARIGGQTPLNRAVRIVHQIGLTLSLGLFVVFIIFEM